MTPPPLSHPSVEVIAPSRLHLGFLDMEGGLGRKFASLGITLDGPKTHLTATPASTTTVCGPSAERAVKVLSRLSAELGLSSPVTLTIHQAIAEHVGLGSGTQMSLAIGIALSRLAGKDTTPRQIANVLDRGARSGIGIAGFETGGVILDGGRANGSGPTHALKTDVPPVLSRLPFPDDWRIILISDDQFQGLSGTAEVEGFKTLPPFPAELAGRLCRLMIMRILPALAEKDLTGFGSGVTELQSIMGDHFAASQGGRFTSPNVAEVLSWFQSQGVHGIGQSSWGPTGFALVPSQNDAENLLRMASDGRYSSVALTLCRGLNTGGTVSLR